MPEKNKKGILGISIVYFLLLVIVSILSFLLIFGIGLAADLNFKLFLITGVFAALWAFTYTWQLPLRKSYKTLYSLSAMIIVYNILLSTLFLDPRAVQNGWIFIGIPVIMLAVWYFFVYQAIQEKRNIHWLIWILFIGVVLFYAWDVTSYYNTNVISQEWI